jgi:putative inorganic carbon (hco3(-)) transporter
MLRSTWLLFVYVAFMVLGASAPFVATLGYVWVDTFRPQNVAYIILNQIPVAMIMGVTAIGSYLLLDRRSPPPLSLEIVLSALMAVWVTTTLIWAEVPDAAWAKWDWAFKTLVFATFIPFVIRSRIQIEAFAQTYVFSLAANIVPFGLKTLISGGGYGTNLGLLQGNAGLAEGGLLSTICLMAIPLAVFLSKHSQLIPRIKILGLAYWAIAGLAVATAIGTYQRSALVGLIVLGIYMWIRSRHKFAFGLVIIIVASLVAYTASSGWSARISTIGTYQADNSALIRILVWKWTLNYTATHPMGGGFDVYLIDHVDVPGTGNEPGFTQFARAFHSIYFEMLGEQGYPGLIMFLMLAVSTIVRLHRLSKKARVHPELEWLAALSDAVQSGLVVFLACGAFVGIAFQPMFWFFVAMGISLNAYMWRVEHPETKTIRGVRLPETTASTEPIRLPPAQDWRNRRASPNPNAGLPRR